MSQRPVWEPSDADLTAYLLNDLGGARAEYVEAHLQQCAECRKRLSQLQQALTSLKTMQQPNSDDLQQHAIKRRIEAEAAGGAATQDKWIHRARIGLVIVAMLTLAIALGPSLSSAGNAAIRDLIGVDSDLRQPTEPAPAAEMLTLPTANPDALPEISTIEPSTLPYAPIAPSLLPGDNQLVSSMAFTNGSFIADYRGSDGLSLALRQEPATTDGIRLGEGLETTEITIGDTDVVVVMGIGLDDVDQMFWVRGGMFFTLRSVRLPDGAFPLDEAIQTVELIIMLQDHPEEH